MVHSKEQMEHFGLIIDNKSCSAGGKQCIIAPEGYTIPVHVCDGLGRIDMKIPVDSNMEKSPHVFIMADLPWDPLALDNKFDEEFCDAVTQLAEVQEGCDGVGPCIDKCGFICSQEDYGVLFQAQDNFVAANLTTVLQ